MLRQGIGFGTHAVSSALVVLVARATGAADRIH
jgi:hypothetical protein